MLPQLLHVITAEPKNMEEADDALRAMRRCLPRKQDHRTILLFCDLPACRTAVSAQDEAVIRRLQSGVMAAEHLRKDAFILLVRRRVWSDALRMYLGRSQSASVRQIVFDLLLHGETDAAFHAATRSLSAFKDRFAFALFQDVTLACTPDTPARMLRILTEQSLSCIGSCVVSRTGYSQHILARLQHTGFSLSALKCADDSRRILSGLTIREAPVLYHVKSFSAREKQTENIPSASGCFFVRRFSPSLHDFFAAEHERALRSGSMYTLIPVLQIVLFFFSALSGYPLPALLTMLLPELWSLFHPRLLPGVLIRLSLLPLTSAAVLDAWLCRLFARSPLLRIRVPFFFFTGTASCAAGMMLGAAAFSGMHALYVLLPIILLWLSSPLIIRALPMPTIERIPLTEDEMRQFRTYAETAFFRCRFDDPAVSSMPKLMLAACAGSMLNLLEPDEAARRVHHLFGALTASSVVIQDSVDQACLICCAQYLREQMEKCDAALRGLPASIDCFVLSQPVPEGDHALGLLLRAAHLETFPAASDRIRRPLEVLFLPCSRRHEMTPVLPFTHPHTFLRLQLTGGLADCPETDAPDDFLALCAAAFSHPFYALLCRSSVSSPYALLYM